MAQHEKLGVVGPVRASTQHQQVDDKSDETVEAGHVLSLIDAGRSNRLEARNPSSRHQTSSRHPQDGLTPDAGSGTCCVAPTKIPCAAVISTARPCAEPANPECRLSGNANAGTAR